MVDFDDELFFPENAGSETKNSLSKVYDSIVNANLSLFNEKEYFNRVFDAVNTINMTIDNLRVKIDEVRKSLNEITSDEGFVRNLDENRVVSDKVYSLLREFLSLQNEIILWQEVKFSFLKVLSVKQNKVLSVVKVFEVEKEALKRFDDIYKFNFDNMKMLLELVLNNLRQELVSGKKEELNTIISGFNKISVELAQKGIDYGFIDSLNKDIDEKLSSLEKNFNKRIEEVLKLVVERFEKNSDKSKIFKSKNKNKSKVEEKIIDEEEDVDFEDLEEYDLDDLKSEVLEE